MSNRKTATPKNTEPFTTSSLPRLGGRSAGAAEPATQLAASLARVRRRSTRVNTNFGLERIASKIVSLCSKKVTTRLGHFQTIANALPRKLGFTRQGRR